MNIDGLDIIYIQENERQRIANELHDSSIQNLTHLIHMIDLSSMYIDQDPVRGKLELESCIQFLKVTIDEMRDTVFNLRPMTFDDLGFKECIDNLITNIKKDFKHFEIEYQVSELKNVDQLILVTIYRIIKEIMINALKHSDGNKIILNVIQKEEYCCIDIADNGKGFSFDDLKEKRDKHFGISIVKERIDLLHGNISFSTEQKKGTEVKIRIPLGVIEDKEKSNEHKSNVGR